MSKPAVAFYWCASCGGCEEAVVDLAEDILKVVEAVDIVLWPVALDFKYSDVEALDDGALAVSFINGAIRTEEQEKIAHLLRKKSQLVIAFGACSHMGGIPGLANLTNRDTIFDTAYLNTPSTVNPEGTIPLESVETPNGELTLPHFDETVRTLDQTVEVDYYIPGCAPTPDLIMKAVNALLSGELPPRGAVIAEQHSLCKSCPRNESKPDKLKVSEIKRIHEVQVDPDTCFLSEGVICLGPATRAGCGHRCIEGNMPCRGCFGPLDAVEDIGAGFISGLASIIDAETPEEAQKITSSIIDPAGLFYMYSVPGSILKKKRENRNG